MFVEIERENRRLLEREHCLCETVNSTSYDVSGLFWADSFDNSIAVRVSSPSQSSPHSPWIYSHAACRFIQLNLSDCTRSRVKKRTMIGKCLSFLGRNKRYLFIHSSDIAIQNGQRWHNVTIDWNKCLDASRVIYLKDLVIYLKARCLISRFILFTEIISCKFYVSDAITSVKLASYFLNY